MARAVAIVNPKGGVGKTTTAVNVAAVIAGLGHRTLLVDLDPDGAAALAVGIDHDDLTAGILDVFGGKLTPRRIIRRTSVENLDLLPSYVRTSEEGRRLVELAADVSVLRRLVYAALTEYEWVFLDCPPSLGSITVDALVAVDGIVIPVQCGYYAMKSLAKLLRLVRAVNERANERLEIDGVLVTMYDGRTTGSRRVLAELRENLGDLVFETFVPHNARLNEATFYGVPGVLFDPSSSGAHAYRSAALELKSRVESKASAAL